MAHPATDRLSSEQVFHDRQARERESTFAHQPDQLQFTDETYLDHETWIRPAFERLGDVRGLRVLDYGCGHGMAAVVLARRGGQVTAFDLSGGYLAEARRRAEANGVKIEFVQADGERLPFADRCFDRVWGNAVLHHLDLPVAARELARVLRPGGRAVFCEPLGDNPLLRWARRRLPYPGKTHTPDEAPFRFADLQGLTTVFREVSLEGYQLLGMIRRAAGLGQMGYTLDCCDRALLARFPSLQRYCRYVVLTVRR